jgi:hypothetical protein
VLSVFVRNLSEVTDLREVLTKKIAVEQEKVKSFRKQYGNNKVGEVTIDMVCKTLFVIVLLCYRQYFEIHKMILFYYNCV